MSPFKREMSSVEKLITTKGTFSVLCMSMLCIVGTMYKFGYFQLESNLAKSHKFVHFARVLNHYLPG